MPRNNKITERVFADIAGTPHRKEAYIKFLELDTEMGLNQSDLLISMKKLYMERLNSSESITATSISILARIEEIIIQIRAKEVIESELRLSLSRDYIYARSLFYRRDNQINDIRVIVGKTSEYGDNLDELLDNEMFRSICKDKLHEAMDREIEKNVQYLIQPITV